MTEPFNPDEYAVELEAAGVPKQQAAIHARYLRAVLSVVADKFDLLVVRITALGSELAITKAELNAKLDILRSDFNGLRLRLDGMDKRLGRLEIAFCASLFMSAANLALVVRLSYP